jgi:hypothetical protein
VHPQRALEPYRAAVITSFRVVRFDQTTQLALKHNPVHLDQELHFPDLAPVACEVETAQAHAGETSLFDRH